MAKSTQNSGKLWTISEKKQLRALANQNTPTGIIAMELGRTKAAVQSMASQLKISLKPTNQSPYNRRKK